MIALWRLLGSSMGDEADVEALLVEEPVLLGVW